MHPLLKAGGRALALRLDRLRETIRTAAERLRASLAHLLGETLTDTVRDVFQTVFDRPGPYGPCHYPPSYGDRYVPASYRRRYDEDDPLAPWLWTEDYVYAAGGRLLAAERPAEEGGRRFFHLDHLGTPRLITGTNGQAIEQHDYTIGLHLSPMPKNVPADTQGCERYGDYAINSPVLQPQRTLFLGH